jgi:thiosulfate reductase cytochrome b subunit
VEHSAAHPRHIRITHWINAVILLVMLWSGFAMLVADRHFAAYVHLVPAQIWSALQLTGHKLQGRAWHLGMALAFIANALLYAISSFATGTWRRIAPRRTWLRDAWAAAIEELTAPRESLQRAEYNGAQRLSYTLVMIGGAVMVLSGLALWFGRQQPWLLAVFGGERVALTIHVVLALALIAFVVVHVVQVLRAGSATLLGMISGGVPERPARARRSVAWSAGVMASVVAAFIIAARTSGPTGVPAFLRWTVPAHGAREAAAAPRPHDRTTGGNERG